MGLLDDAIREHLDLKRRRGADPSEVERAEQEALGPVRREPQEVAVDDAPPGLEDGLEPEFAYPDGQTEWDDALEREPDPFAAEPEPPRAEPEAGAEPEPVAPPPVAARTKERTQPEPPDEAVEPHPADEQLEHGEETAEYDVPGAIEHERRKEGDDVLEETPEFLQDTPDHDRLWFEQKPPRDFDFDG